MNFREVAVRAGKTFIQSFCGVLIPELCMVLSKAVPDATFWTVALPPLLCAALAAGISAAWNIVAIALAPDVVPVPSEYAPFSRVLALFDEFEFAASQLVQSDFSDEALSYYADAALALAREVATECSVLRQLLSSDEPSPSEQ